MRLHRLEMTAFGPFAQTATVDFDALSAAGLFLLSGATGAGKTSVLDAVCFALYGAVPGDRNDAKRLRSDQASDDEPPRVVLDATLAGRRFRITRSPAWSRPKKRGTGTTPQQASVVVSELVGGEWVPLATRLDDAGHLVSGLVGMNLTQFTQVVMLPQGRFQAFLRASSEDRHRLLQQLFRTERFEQVERWLRDRRASLRQAADEHERSIEGLVHRVSETAEVSPPAADEPLTSWSSGLAASSHELAASLTQAVPGLRDAEVATRAALESGRATAAQQERYALARREHDDLLDRADEVAGWQQALAEAARARSVTAVRRVASAATTSHQEAEARLERQRREAAVLVGAQPADLTAEAMPALLVRAADAAAAARALLPRERERADLAARLSAAQTDRGAIGLDELRRDAAAARGAALRLPAEETACEQAALRLEACRTLHRLRNELVAAQLDLNQVVTARLAVAEELMSLQQARLEGMAAELAGRLAVGGACPVCGSEHHPVLAAPMPDAPDAAAEKVLRKRLVDAEFEEQARAGHAKDLELQAALALQSAGTDDLDELQQAVAVSTAVLAASRGQAAEADRLHHLVERAADLEAAIDALTRRHAELSGELAEALGEEHHDLPSLVAHAEATSRALGAVRDAHAASAAAARTRDDAELALATAAAEAGFADVAAALAAALPDDEVDRLRAAVDEHSARTAALAAVLSDPAVVAAAGQEPPDLPTLQRVHDATSRELVTTLAAERRESARAARLAELCQQLCAALDAWWPVRDELELVGGLAAFVEGKSGDNRLQMRLSAYVLGYRLSQVVAAANARLATMSDRRYSLEHTGRRGAGERRGGLSLLVRDDWSGESRDPATLSGGETFVVSLALALGLADVIVHEVGGATLDTLFVDEGFGSLDADTLDDVMDTLDSLRDGGRVVGVVSHVAEMRDRIPTQLVVDKSRGGSSVRLRGQPA
jgi:exonuclease SbcC